MWVPIIRSWALTTGFALHPGTRNRYEIRYTRTQHRPPSRQVNDHDGVSGTHRGSNYHGQADVPAGTFEAIAAGDGHSCGLRSDGVIVCWGELSMRTADPVSSG